MRDGSSRYFVLLLCMIFEGNVKAYDYSYAFTSVNDGREEMAP